MGQASRTTKLLLNLDDRAEGGANTGKRAYLEETARILDAARAFYVAFFLAHPDKLTERVAYSSEKHAEMRERLISPNELLTWAESLTVATHAHPHPLPSYNFSERFPEFPFIYRRSVIKDAIGVRPQGAFCTVLKRTTGRENPYGQRAYRRRKRYTGTEHARNASYLKSQPTDSDARPRSGMVKARLL